MKCAATMRGFPGCLDRTAGALLLAAGAWLALLSLPSQASHFAAARSGLLSGYRAAALVAPPPARIQSVGRPSRQTPPGHEPPKAAPYLPRISPDPAVGPHHAVGGNARVLKLTHGSPGVRTIALTFDDGPHPEYTPKLLALLEHYQVKVTFFVVGKMVERYPDLVRMEQAAGHEIGNHTFDHVNVTRLPDDQVTSEWAGCERAVQAITGLTMKYCRPPGGRYDRATVSAASRLGLTTVLWTDNSADYASHSASRMERRVLARVSNGGIILMHDGVQQTIEVLPQLIETLRRRGYRFVTLSEMQAESARRPTGPSASHRNASPYPRTPPAECAPPA